MTVRNRLLVFKMNPVPVCEDLSGPDRACAECSLFCIPAVQYNYLPYSAKLMIRRGSFWITRGTQDDAVQPLKDR